MRIPSGGDEGQTLFHGAGASVQGEAHPLSFKEEPASFTGGMYPAPEEVPPAEGAPGLPPGASLPEPFHWEAFGGRSIPEDDHPVAQGAEILDLMGHVEDGNIRLHLQIPEFSPEAAAQGAVEGAERFVEEQQLGLGGQGPGKGHPLALPSGEAGGGSGPRTPKASSVRAIRWLFSGRLSLREGQRPHSPPPSWWEKRARL